MNARRLPVLILSVGLLAGLLAGVLAGCSADPTRGYAFGGTFDSSIQTVRVPVVDNFTFFPSLGPDVTDALIKEVQRRTPWTVLQSIEADATLVMTIEDADLRQLATSTNTGLVQEVALVADVSFSLTDNRSGRVLVARDRFRAAGSFLPDTTSRERLAVGSRDLAQRLAEDTVATLRNDF